MKSFDRRSFLRVGSLGVGVAAGAGLVLPEWARPTEPSGGLGTYGVYLARRRVPEIALSDSAKPTEENILGPYFREGSPFRAKVTPPLEPGKVLLIRGRVWGFDTKQPLAHATIDVWQANDSGRYDNDDPDKPPASDVFVNRARLITDEEGRYEFETIKPGAYQTGPGQWRPCHIHYLVRHEGYKTLITQLYFQGDEHQDTDRFIRPSLIIALSVATSSGGSYREGTFDIVLAK